MDKLSSARRSWNMSRIRSGNTKPEIVVRRLLHRLGYRYRVHQSGLPGKPDIVFFSRRKVIFVHGCFWHQHAGCIDCSKPKNNSSYWQAKLERNVLRDAESLAALKKLRFKVLILWECEVMGRRSLDARLIRFLGPPRHTVI